MTPGNEFPVNRTGDNLTLGRILNPEQPVVLVLMEHRGCSQRSDMEADLMAVLARRLIVGHGLAPDQMALVTFFQIVNAPDISTHSDWKGFPACFLG